MKRIFFHSKLLCYALFILSAKVHAQTISYQSIPGFSASQNCFFNIPPGPTNPVTIGGYSHYGVTGGVDYTGNEFSLPSDATGGGTAFGIYHPFSQNYKYTIKVKAKASATSMKLLWALNSARQAIPSSCSPGFATIITSGASATSSITSLSGTYNEYTLIENFTPATANVTYILLAAYNTVASIGSVMIQEVNIIATPLCKPPVVTNAIPLGGLETEVSFTTPAFDDPISEYKIFMLRYTIIPTFPPIFLPVQGYEFPNVGSTSPVPVEVTVPGNYIVSMQSVCPTETINSNSVQIVVN